MLALLTRRSRLDGSDIMTGAGSPNRSIERAARMLDLFAPDRPRLTLAELSELLGSSRATTHRYATALCRAGLLRYEERGRAYALGHRIVHLAAGAVAGLEVLRIAERHLDRLSQEARETAILAIWDGESQVVVSQVESPRTAHVVLPIGVRMPSTSAVGKVLCAFRPGMAESPFAECELLRVRATGIATGAEVGPGIYAVASPVLQGRALVGTIALIGTVRLTQTESIRTLAGLLRGTASRISADLGPRSR
jgi:DNA-binding IclR family transcriptional regulator